MAVKGIICFEAEWLFRKSSNKFNLNSEPLFHWLKEFYNCNVIYRHILSKVDLSYYFDYFSTHKRESNRYDIVYIACHGSTHSISLEGDEPDIDLLELAEMSNGFFEDKIVHFGSCKTMANQAKAEEFKRRTGARLVSGYKVNVDAMESAIADVAYFNELMSCRNVGIFKNKETSKFWKKYRSLLNDLKFEVY